VNPLTIFACENQPVVLEGLYSLLGKCTDLQLSGHAPDFETALPQIASARPDILLLGQPTTVKSVLPILTRARQVGVASKVVAWVSEIGDMDSFRAVQMGARGVITRRHAIVDFLECLRNVGAGEIWMKPVQSVESPVSAAVMVRITPRESQILELVCEGLRNREIAERMSIAPGTVKVHLMHIFEKTGIRDRFQLALHGRRLVAAARCAERGCATAQGPSYTGGT
jgi:DNA-binding NarL/FixJ family response regulator